MHNSEIHLFIIWSNAERAVESIISDIKQYLKIKVIYKIEWSQDKFSENMSRFYGQNLPKDSDKEGHCGIGAFTCIVVEDCKPQYHTRETSKGFSNVNTNIFDLKVKYRNMIGGYQIHATDNIQESLHDLSLLFGEDVEYFKNISSDSTTIHTLKQNLIGTDGWESIEQLFEYLNKFTKYIVLRNFECLPYEYTMKEHGDIDLLVENLEEIVYLTNAKKVFSEPYRVHYSVMINGEEILFDFRYVGDDYYDERFEKFLLSERVLDDAGFYRPTYELYFVSLLYHALVHKINFSDDYKNRLRVLAKKIKLDDVLLSYNPALLMIDEMDKYHITLTKPIDDSVHYNKEVAQIYLAYENLMEIYKSKHNIDEILANDNRWLILKHLSPIRQNILNWYPFKKKASVLELGGECGVITELLCSIAGSITVLEPSKRRATINYERNSHHTNLEIITGSVNDIESNQKFDYITLIGILEYAGSFTKTDNPYEDFLKNIKSYLKDDGKLLIAIENRYGLKYFAGAKEDHTGKEFDGITGYIDNDNVRTFGKSELEGLLSKAGFEKLNFYYPHPDYKMPFEIYSDDFLPNADEFISAAPNFDSDRYELFNESLAYKGIIENGQYPFFANSFFVECGV